MSAHILVADDSTTMRKIILRSLAAAGITDVVEAEDGDEAIALFQPDQFDLVLTDWRMPGQTGIEVARSIRALDTQIPIILMATELEPYPAAEAAEAGISDRLVKPFSPEAIRSLMDKHAGTSSAAASGPGRRTTAGNTATTRR